MATIWRTGPETQVNASANLPYAPSVATLADGGYIIVWGAEGPSSQDEGYTIRPQDVLARRYSASGVAGPEFKVDFDDWSARYDLPPSVAATADGGFVIGWTQEQYRPDPAQYWDEAVFTPYARTYAADNSFEFVFSGDTKFESISVEERLVSPTLVAGWREDGHVVASATPYYNSYISLDFYSSAGLVADNVLFLGELAADTGSLALARLKNDHTVLAASVKGTDGADIIAQIFDVNAKTLSVISVNTGNAGDQTAPAVAGVGSAGGFVVVWASDGPNDTDEDIRGQIYNSAGGRVGGEFRVNTDVSDRQLNPQVTTLSGGGFVVVWETLEYVEGTSAVLTVHAQRFTAAGARVGGEVTVATGVEADVAALANDAFVMTWIGGNGVSQRIFQAPAAITTPRLTTAAEIFDGDATAETFLAAPGTLGAGDALHGRGGIDTLRLTAAGTLDLTKANEIDGIERLLGSSGNDLFIVNDRSLQDFTSFAGGGGTDAFVVNARFNFTLKAGLNVAELRPLDPSQANNLFIYGNEFGQRITGAQGENNLYGRGGNDTLIGAAGEDRLYGGIGDDTFYVEVAGDAVIEGAGEGADTILAATNYVLSAEASIEVLKTQNAAGRASIQLTGNGYAQAITGNAGANLLDGQGGADTMAGLGGSDTYVVDDAGDRVVEANVAGTDTVFASFSYTLGNFVENLDLSPGSGNPTNGTGNGLANQIIGTYAANRLDGKGGADRMFGLAGDDIYTVDNAGDRVYELAGQGTDSVFSSVTFTLAGQFAENLTLTGAAAVNATGNGLANILTGNAAANVVNGGAGADAMRGGGGNDTYVVDDAGDVVTEARDAGADRVLSSVSLTLSNHVEHLTLTGTGDIAGAGNDLANTIVGNAGRNALDGRTGADVMAGGAGNDSYVVDNAGDRAIEATGGGYDGVFARVSFSLAGQSLEKLILQGSANINGTGNDLANYMEGNSGNNRLDGGRGADEMLGYLGDDTYVVDNVGDVVFEYVDGGTDTVISTISYSLIGKSVENVVLSGAAAIDATGNGAVNKLVGGTGRNVLDGGLGADVLTGNAGFDTFFFNSALGPADIDRITDFVVADDVIRLENAVFAGLATGVLAADAFVVGAAAQDAEDRIIYDRASGRLLYDGDGDGAGAAQQFAFIAKGLAMTRADFVVV